ncbi:MAG TPA: MFS transporter, partial [Caulobacteraceae bacterium]
MTEAVAPGARSPFHVILAFALPGMVLAGMVLVYGVYVPRYYAGLIGNLAVVGGAIAVVRFVDVWFDPFLGLAMDRTRTAIGRYRAWLIAGAPVMMVGIYMSLLPRGTVSSAYMIVWLLVSYLGYSMINLATVAWTSVLAPSYHERSRVYGWTLGLAVLGAIALLLLSAATHGKIVLGKAASMPPIGLILIAATPAAVILCALLTPERAVSAERPRFRLGDYWKAISRPEMGRIILADLALSLGTGTTAPLYVFFFHDAKGFSIAEVGFLLIFYIGASVIGAPAWGRIAKALGKHRTLQIACVCYAIAQSTLMALPRVWPGHGLVQMLPTIAGMFGVGFTASAFILLIRAMVADVVDDVRLESGQDITSLLFSMVTTTNKIGLSVTTAFSFTVLSLVGYNPREGAVNTPHAIFGLEMCYLFAPVILVWFGGAMFFGYKLDANRHAEIRAALASYDEAAALESVTGPTAATEA